MKKKSITKERGLSRRDFLTASAAASLAAIASPVNKLFAAGSDKIRLGLIGCGGRGIYDATNCLNCAPNIEIAALGDLFKDRIDGCLNNLRSSAKDKVTATEETCFTGFDAYKKVLACDIDMVILTEPPHFRPMHLKAAVEAGKHIFMEKPVAVDPAGVRSVIASSELAEQKNLTIVAGTQMRRIAHLVAGMEKIHNGDIGKIVGGQCVRIGSAMFDWGPAKRQTEWSDMEWQIRKWLFVNWLSGDFITEMHIHNLDIVNWALNSHPVRCIGTGGRQVRMAPEFGNIYDHFAVEYEYPEGVRIEFIGAQIDGMSDRNDQWFVGTKGKAYMDFGNAIIEGEKPFKYDGPSPDPCILQHFQQIEAIRNGQKRHAGTRIAESTLTSIMGRMSAYTGRSLKWEWVLNESKLDLSPPKYELGPLPMQPVPMPGKTELV